MEAIGSLLFLYLAMAWAIPLDNEHNDPPSDYFTCSKWMQEGCQREFKQGNMSILEAAQCY